MRIYIDFKSPASRLAIGPTLDFLAQTGIIADWLPYRTAPDKLPVEEAGETKTRRHLRLRAEAARNMHAKYARLRRIPLEFPDAPGCTDLALAGLLYAGSAASAYVEAGFQVYWEDHADLNSPAIVSRLFECAGIDASGFDPESSLSRLEAVQREAEEAGVIDAPAYLFQNDVFIGREHLPWFAAALKQERQEAHD